MTTEDDIDISAAEFDAFLRHEDDLAQLLQNLPQPEPSSQLDAAVLATVTAASGAEGQPKSTTMRTTTPVALAANDAEMNAGARAPRSFVRRWRIPLGLAASLLVTAQLVHQEWQEEQTTQMAPSPSVALNAVVPPVPPQTVPAPASSEDHSAYSGVQSVARNKTLKPGTQEVHRLAAAALQPILPMSAPVPAQQAVPAYVPAPPAALAAAPKASPSPQDDAANVSVYGRMAPEPVPTPAPAPAPMVSARSKVRAAESNTSSATMQPAEWVNAINQLLSNGSNKEAWAEWKKFRKAYPEYAVSENLSERIKTVETEQGKEK